MKNKFIHTLILLLALVGCASIDSTDFVSADDLKYINKDPKVGVAKVGNYNNDGDLRIFERKDDVYIYIYDNNMGSGYLYGLSKNTKLEFYADKKNAKKLADEKIKQMKLQLMANDPDIRPGSNVYHEVSLLSGIEVLIRPYKSSTHFRFYRIELVDYSSDLERFKTALENNELSVLGEYNYYYLQPFLKKEIDKYLYKATNRNELEHFTPIINNMFPTEYTNNMVLQTTRNYCLLKKRITELELISDSMNIQSLNDVTEWTSKRQKVIDRCYKVGTKELIANKTPKKGDLHSKNDWKFYKDDYIQGEVGANWVKTEKRKYTWDPESIDIGYISKRNVKSITPNISKKLIAEVNTKHKNILRHLAKEKDKKDYLYASKNSSISNYQKYLKEHPAGHFVTKAKANLEDLFSKSDSFDGYINAYKVNEASRFLSLAEKSILSLSQGANVNSELVETYFNAAIKHKNTIPKFIDLTKKMQSVNSVDYASRMLKLSGISRNFNPETYLNSIEYKYILSNLIPDVSVSYQHEYIDLLLDYPDFRVRIKEDADCTFKKSESGVRDRGFLESVLSLNLNNKESYTYDVYSCQLGNSELTQVKNMLQGINSYRSKDGISKLTSTWNANKSTGSYTYSESNSSYTNTTSNSTSSENKSAYLSQDGVWIKLSCSDGTERTIRDCKDGYYEAGSTGFTGCHHKGRNKAAAFVCESYGGFN